MNIEAMWPQLVVLGEVAAAMLLGGAIGFERETLNRPAGFRTHMLVAGACALLVGLGAPLLRTRDRMWLTDPTRFRKRCSGHGYTRPRNRQDRHVECRFAVIEITGRPL